MTNEDTELVNSFIATYKPEFPIVIMASDALENAIGVNGFPTTAVMDTEGNLAHSDGIRRGAAAGALSAAMKKAKGPLVPRVFAKVQTALAAGDIAKAFAALAKIKRDKLDENESSWATRYDAALQQSVQDTMSTAEAKLDEGLVYVAVEALEPLAGSKGEFAGKSELDQLYASVQQMPNYAAEIKAAKPYKAALDSLKNYEYTESVKSLKKVYTKYEGTKLAEIARTKATELVESGMPGYQSACNSCRQARAACKKHAEAVKL